MISYARGQGRSLSPGITAARACPARVRQAVTAVIMAKKSATPRQRLTQAAAEFRLSQERLLNDPAAKAIARTIIGARLYDYPRRKLGEH